MQQFLTQPRHERRLFGLTKSDEFEPHIQSYFVVFPVEAIRSGDVATWWDGVQAIDEREKVIQEYELGMSAFFAQRDYSLGSMI